MEHSLIATRSQILGAQENPEKRGLKGEGMRLGNSQI